MVIHCLVFPKYWTNLACHRQWLNYQAFATNRTVKCCLLHLTNICWVSTMTNHSSGYRRAVNETQNSLPALSLDLVEGGWFIRHKVIFLKCCFSFMCLDAHEGDHRSVSLLVVIATVWIAYSCLFFQCITWVLHVKAHEMPQSFYFPPSSHMAS